MVCLFDGPLSNTVRDFVDGPLAVIMAGALLGSLPLVVLYSFFVEHYVSANTAAKEKNRFEYLIARRHIDGFPPPGRAPMQTAALAITGRDSLIKIIGFSLPLV
jgi:hypothetical protein